MAIGTYIGPGSLKELKSCYVGAGGVKTVKEIYVGVGGSPKLVWPAYTDYGGDTVDMLSNSMLYHAFCFDTDNAYYTGNISNDFLVTGFSSDSNTGQSNAQTTFTEAAFTHWIETNEIDTRGYNYIMANFIIYTYYGSTVNQYFCPAVSYGTSGRYAWSIISANLKSSSSSITRKGNEYPTGFTDSTYNIYALYDISNLNVESCYVFFGGKICSGGGRHLACLASNEVKLYKSKPSGADITVTY